jgi:hypothetical protein
MAFTTSTVAPSELRYSEASTAELASCGLLRRLRNAMMASRQREAEREIAFYLQRTGGKFTDVIEREIERRFSKSHW